MEKQVDPQLVARLRAALGSLPTRQRAIFIALVADDAPTYAELGRQFGISVAEVELEFAAALAALARATDGRT